jgi:hypothetical protein
MLSASGAGAAGEVDVAHGLNGFGVPVLRCGRPIDACKEHDAVNRAKLCGGGADRGGIGDITGQDAGRAGEGGRGFGQTVCTAG